MTILDRNRVQIENNESEKEIILLIDSSEHYRFENYKNCIVLGKEAVLLSSLIESDSLKATAFESLGVSCYYNGDYDSAYVYYNQALELHRIIVNEEGIASCLNKIALLYTAWARYKDALDYNQQAYDIRKRLNRRTEMAHSLINIGNVYFYQSNYKKALERYFEALAVFKKLEKINQIAKCYSNIGVIYKQINDSEQAILYLTEAETIFRTTGDERALSATMLNIADIYNFELKEYEKAKGFYMETMELKKKSNDLISIALLNNNLGTLYGNFDDLHLAINYFNLAKGQFEKMNEVSGLIMVDYNIGKVFQAREIYDQAIDFFHKSLDKAVEHQYIDYIGSNQQALFECYAAICDNDNFEKYLQLYTNGVDTVLNRLNQAEMLEVEAKYKYEETKSQNEKLEKNLILQNNQIKKYRNYAFGALAILVLLVVAFIMYLISRKK